MQTIPHSSIIMKLLSLLVLSLDKLSDILMMSQCVWILCLTTWIWPLVSSHSNICLFFPLFSTLITKTSCLDSTLFLPRQNHSLSYLSLRGGSSFFSPPHRIHCQLPKVKQCIVILPTQSHFLLGHCYSYEIFDIYQLLDFSQSKKSDGVSWNIELIDETCFALAS